MLDVRCSAFDVRAPFPYACPHSFVFLRPGRGGLFVAGARGIMRGMSERRTGLVIMAGTMRTFVGALAAGAGVMVSAAEIPQVERLFDEAAAWDTAAAAAAKRWRPFGFRWMDAAKTDLRWFEPRQAFLQHGHLATNLEGRLPDIQVLGERPVEVVLRFRDDRLAGMSTVFYSRGDSGDTHVTNLLALARTVEIGRAHV